MWYLPLQLGIWDFPMVSRHLLEFGLWSGRCPRFPYTPERHETTWSKCKIKCFRLDNTTWTLPLRTFGLEQTYQEVGLIEIIRHIPTDLAVLASFLHHSMEEGQHINQTAKGWVSTAHELIMRDLKICRPHVQLQPIWRFCYNLKATWEKLVNMEINIHILNVTH